MGAWDQAGMAAETLGFLTVLWADCRFLRESLGSTRRKEGLFLLLMAGGTALLHLWNVWRRPPYLLQALVHHLLFLGAVYLLFPGGRGKKLLAFAILLALYVMLGAFGESLFSMALLLAGYLRRPDSGMVLGEGEGLLVACLCYALISAAVFLCARRFHPAGDEPTVCLEIFGGCKCGSDRDELKNPDIGEERPGRWYVILAVPLLGFSILTDVVNWGASHGILVKSGNRRGIFYDQLCSYGGICILAALSIAAAGFYLLGMVQTEREQRKGRRYEGQLLAYRMLEAQRGKTDRLRHDMKNHILALSGLARGCQWERLERYLQDMEQQCGLCGNREATGNQRPGGLRKDEGRKGAHNPSSGGAGARMFFSGGAKQRGAGRDGEEGQGLVWRSRAWPRKCT